MYGDAIVLSGLTKCELAVKPQQINTITLHRQRREIEHYCSTEMSKSGTERSCGLQSIPSTLYHVMKALIGQDSLFHRNLTI